MTPAAVPLTEPDDDNPICPPCRHGQHDACEFRTRWCGCSRGLCWYLLVDLPRPRRRP